MPTRAERGMYEDPSRRLVVSNWGWPVRSTGEEDKGIVVYVGSCCWME